MSLRSAHSRGLVPATSSGDQVLSCELAILIKKCSRREQNLVSATSPMNPMISNWFEFLFAILLLTGARV